MTIVPRFTKKVAKLEGAPIRVVKGTLVRDSNPAAKQKHMNFASLNLQRLGDHVTSKEMFKFHFF